MTEKDTTPTEPEENESFADLLEAYSSTRSDDIQVGDKISCPIIAVGESSVFVDTGTKVDGVVEKQELMDEKDQFPFAEGDILELYVIARAEDEIRLSRAISGIGGLNMLQEAYSNKIPVEGKVSMTCKGGFRVEVLKHSAFCPISQIDIKYVEQPEEYVGQIYEFLIIQFEQNGRNIVISRRNLLEKEQQKNQQAFFADLKIGDVVDARVTRLMPYGVFAELVPGVEGMIHISELSWSRLAKVEDAVAPGDLLQTKVLSINDGKKPGQKKISLSVKQVTIDPWQNIGDKFSYGDKVKGKITRCMNFGVFVEIAPGIEGLVHISEMSHVKRVHNPADEVNPGETVFVMVKEFDAAKKRVSLSMKDAQGDPWVLVEEKYEVGKIIKGQLDQKERFGYFITLEPGITGLLPISAIKKAENYADLEKLKPGQTLLVNLLKIDKTEKKILLGPANPNDSDEWKEFTGNKEDTFSALGEKLQQALRSAKK